MRSHMVTHSPSSHKPDDLDGISRRQDGFSPILPGNDGKIHLADNRLLQKTHLPDKLLKGRALLQDTGLPVDHDLHATDPLFQSMFIFFVFSIIILKRCVKFSDRLLPFRLSGNVGKFFVGLFHVSAKGPPRVT